MFEFDAIKRDSRLTKNLKGPPNASANASAICKECNKEMTFKPKSKKPTLFDMKTYKCCKCFLYFRCFDPHWACEGCKYRECELCGHGINPRCIQCGYSLTLAYEIKGKSTFDCDGCKKRFDCKKGIYYCYRGHSYCTDCRCNFRLKGSFNIMIEKQRFWKNQWKECPLLPGGFFLS